MCYVPEGCTVYGYNADDNGEPFLVKRPCSSRNGAFSRRSPTRGLLKTDAPDSQLKLTPHSAQDKPTDRTFLLYPRFELQFRDVRQKTLKNLENQNGGS
jgi:hypothetical protein